MSNARQTMLLFWRHAWRYPGYVISLIITVPLAILTFQFLPPLVVARILDRINHHQFIPGQLWESFGPLLVLYAVISLLGGIVLWRVAIIIIWKLEMRVQQDIYQRIFDHLLGQSATFHANRFGGSLVSQTNKFASAYVRMADTTIFQMVGLVLSFIFTFFILAPRAPLVVAVLFAFALLFMVTAIWVTKKVRRLNAAEASAQNKQTGFLADAVTNVMAIKSFASNRYERERFAEATELTRQASHNLMVGVTYRDIYFSGATGLLNIAALVLAAVAVVLFNADIGTTFLIVTYAGIISQRLWDFSQSTLRNYNRAIGDAQEMTEILAITPEVKDPPRPEKPRIHRGEIAFREVSFAHDGSEDAPFKKLSLTIQPGEKIGLIGHSGSGKTTFTRLLLRFSDIDAGQILIDGQNIARITQEDLRAHIAYVPQEPLLFHRSLRENIGYSKPGASENEIREAARKAHAAEFIEKLPQRYDTLVGERGVKLSGGQRQRIAIARAILKDAPILVLDEATSALDSESEKHIQAALWELMKGRTAIAIAHRLSTIQRMDRIVVLEDGHVAEQGTHRSLLTQKGIYAELWAHQSGGFIEE